MTRHATSGFEQDRRTGSREYARAMLNILDDFDEEKTKLQSAQKAVLNILEDFAGERAQMELTYKGLLNILEDFDAEKHKVEQANLGMAREIAERKRLEAQLAEHRDHLEELVEQRTGELQTANIKLQELDRLKSMFIASMSHELRTPLNSIIGFTGILLQGLAGEMNEEQRRQLAIVKGSANHLLSLINDVIDISKIEAGKMEVSIAPFDLSALVREVAATFSQAAQTKGLRIAVSGPDSLEAESDDRRVRQVLVNLVANAIKFTDRGSVEIALRMRDGGAEVSVRDTGIGIRQEDLSRLFGAFSQVITEGRPREGSGLGLYLSKKIADLLGGQIGADSKFGVGSVFNFTLPLRHSGG
ncbi:MAG: ATP-binding protein [Methanomassiliicoccales archaeon]|nr:ATP-binding protein [Methanomassiliicoccales archaeon]